MKNNEHGKSFSLRSVTHFFLKHFKLAILATVVLSGCGSAGNNPPTSSTTNTVSATTPASGANGVSISSAVSATFSAAIDASTLNTSTFTLTGPSGSVAGTVTYNATTNTATFTPSAALAYNTTYTATITTGVKDLAGNPLASNYSWSFTTIGGAVTIVSSGSSGGGSWVGNTWTPSTTASTVLASEIVSHLAIGPTAIYTNVSGDIIVNGAVSWSANNTLTLSSVRDIKVNANISATGNTAGLMLSYGTGRSYTLASGASIKLSGATPALKIGVAGSEVSYTVINSLGVAGDTSGTTLQGMNGNLSGHYALGSNIDATATSGWNSGAGFVPIGTFPGMIFTGYFDGLGHTINNLVINRPTIDYVGLFGVAGTGSIVRNVGLVGGSVRGSSQVGGIVGVNHGGSVSNSYATGNVSGTSLTTGYVGGLVGYNYGTVSNSYATGNVSGSAYVGGLVGLNGGTPGATVSNSYATGNVSMSGSGSGGGGLVGQNDFTVSNSYAIGNVSSSNWYIGGLVGINWGSVSNSYATGSASGGNGVGGLIGTSSAGTVSNSYATGSVSGNYYIGGLVGYIYDTNTVISNSFWDTQTSRQTIGIGLGPTTGATATGLTTAQMMTQASFVGFDFTNTWWMNEGNTRPLLRQFPVIGSPLNSIQ